jgi:hypothetical protein
MRLISASIEPSTMPDLDGANAFDDLNGLYAGAILQPFIPRIFQWSSLCGYHHTSILQLLKLHGGGHQNNGK